MAMGGLFYEQFHVGQRFEHVLRRTVTEADNLFFSALTHNPAALHLDEEYMKGTRVRHADRQQLFHAEPDGGDLGGRHDARYDRRQPRLGRSAVSEARVHR
jgi:hypothetical protein